MHTYPLVYIHTRGTVCAGRRCEFLPYYDIMFCALPDTAVRIRVRSTLLFHELITDKFLGVFPDLPRDSGLTHPRATTAAAV